ncbi:MAG: hypothetical protein IJY51_10305 [Treponema sp.]|uniref:hypothetical protein n=1 Tax=Treponema sp. TaxID=166 RepID=UPI00257DCC8C|nr:hypothetical protein [Treponema sp.]MBQ9103442.1 hypothetical protein [Treponema sp.]
MSKKTQEIRSIFQELGSLQKRIENLKSQAPELEEKILPSLEHELKFTDSSLRLEQLPEEIKNASLELQKIIQELEN